MRMRIWMRRHLIQLMPSLTCSLKWNSPKTPLRTMLILLIIEISRNSIHNSFLEWTDSPKPRSMCLPSHLPAVASRILDIPFRRQVIGPVGKNGCVVSQVSSKCKGTEAQDCGWAILLGKPPDISVSKKGKRYLPSWPTSHVHFINDWFYSICSG